MDDGDGFEDVVLTGRMCIVSRQSLAAEQLVRFVRAPDGSVVPDLRRRLPGRGAHVEATAAAVRLAVKRQLLKRALGPDVEVPQDLAEMVEMLLTRHTLGSLGLARKARQLATGATKVEAEIRGGRALALLQATDGAPDGLRKMAGALKVGAHRNGDADAGAPLPPVYRLFTADELGLALGGVNVVHAAVLAGDAGSAACRRLAALEGFRGSIPAETLTSLRSEADVGDRIEDG